MNVSDNQYVSSACKTDLNYFLNSLNLFDPWALESKYE
jgi:hypothetical protein